MLHHGCRRRAVTEQNRDQRRGGAACQPASGRRSQAIGFQRSRRPLRCLHLDDRKGADKLPYVKSARVNLTAKRVSCVWYEEMNGKPVSPAGILSAIAGCGYQAHLFTADLSDDDRVRNQLLLAVGVSGFAAANIMCFPSRSGPGRRLQRATCSIGYRQ